MSDLIFVVLLGVIAGVAQMDWLKKWRYAWALDVVRLAVAWTYNEVVRPQKQENGGKLSNEQAKKAREEAITKTLAIAKENGLDINKILGADLLELYVEMAVSKAKKGQ